MIDLLAVSLFHQAWQRNDRCRVVGPRRFSAAGAL
jgi:hypothetical protein